MADYTGTNNNDTIVANGQADNISGLDGDDTIDAKGGADVVDVGAGNDFIKGRGGADVLYGGTGNDKIRGGGGNDVVIGGAGADNVKGNNGTDTLSYEGSDAGVTVDLGARTASGGHAEGDVIDGTFENLTGSSWDDTLTGSAGNNVLTGGAGNDSLDGGAGTDTAVFTGNLADYHLIAENGVITVTDLRGGANDGIDILVNFESL